MLRPVAQILSEMGHRSPHTNHESLQDRAAPMVYNQALCTLKKQHFKYFMPLSITTFQFPSASASGTSDRQGSSPGRLSSPQLPGGHFVHEERLPEGTYPGRSMKTRERSTQIHEPPHRDRRMHARGGGVTVTSRLAVLSFRLDEQHAMSNTGRGRGQGRHV